jgi:hypothetical protein
MPTLLVVVLVGAAVLARAARVKFPELSALALAGVLATFSLVGLSSVSRQRQECRAIASYEDPRCHNLQARSYMPVLQYVKDSLPADAVVATSKPSTLYLLTKRLAMPLSIFATINLADAEDPGRVVTHILLEKLYSSTVSSVAPRLYEECQSLTLVARFPLTTMILRRRTASDTLRPTACAALQDYLRETTSPRSLSPG